MKKALFAVMLGFIVAPAFAKYNMTSEQYNDFMNNCQTKYENLVLKYEDNEHNQSVYKKYSECICDVIKRPYIKSEFRTIDISNEKTIYLYIQERSGLECIDIYELDLSF
ncbi:MAG: hypothetical protein LBK26_01095 [Rickettsiales bacterium]|nr:hypothetical protein [Rickettsiales bacterium]